MRLLKDLQRPFLICPKDLRKVNHPSRHTVVPVVVREDQTVIWLSHFPKEFVRESKEEKMERNKEKRGSNSTWDEEMKKRRRGEEKIRNKHIRRKMNKKSNKHEGYEIRRIN
ncbi:unnamed protein product [Arabidopsis lyrata]|nr:unnamed protein product [Arabidopsis lyrata]